MKNHILINPLLLEQDQDQKEQTTDIFNFDTKIGNGDLEQEVESSGRLYGPENYTLTELGGKFSDAVRDRDKKAASDVMRELGIRAKEGTGEQTKKAQEKFEELQPKFEKVKAEIKKILDEKGEATVLAGMKTAFEATNPKIINGMNAEEAKEYGNIKNLEEFYLFKAKIEFLLDELIDEKGRGALDFESRKAFERDGADYKKLMGATNSTIDQVRTDLKLKYKRKAVVTDPGTNILEDFLRFAKETGGVLNAENLKKYALKYYAEKDEEGNYVYTGTEEEKDDKQSTVNALSTIVDWFQGVQYILTNLYQDYDTKNLARDYRQYYRNLGKEIDLIKDNDKKIKQFSLTPKGKRTGGKRRMIYKKVFKNLIKFWLTDTLTILPGTVYAAVTENWDYRKDAFWSQLTQVEREIITMRARVDELTEYAEKMGRDLKVGPRLHVIPYGRKKSKVDLDDYSRTITEIEEYIEKLETREEELKAAGAAARASVDPPLPDDGPKRSSSPNWAKRAAKNASEKVSIDPKNMEVMVDGKWVSYEDLDKATAAMASEKADELLDPSIRSNKKFMQLLRRMLPGLGKGGKGGKGGDGTKALPPAKDLDEQNQEKEGELGFLDKSFSELNKTYYKDAVQRALTVLYFAAQQSNNLAAALEQDLQNTIEDAKKIVASAKKIQPVKESKIKITKSKLVDLISEQVKEQTQTVDVTKEQLVALVAEEACKQINRKK